MELDKDLTKLYQQAIKIVGSTQPEAAAQLVLASCQLEVAKNVEKLTQALKTEFDSLRYTIKG